MPIGMERDIFADAIEIESLQQRREFVEKACGEDQTLRQLVDDLLAQHDQTDNVVDRPIAGGPMPTLPFQKSFSSSSRYKIGSFVGPYRLMEQVGEGGFGLVFVADQQTPVRRRVALKIIKPGMATREVIARFEAERQAIAMMNHENIARIFDAGVTDDEQPYFAMELVRGVPMMEFCDNHKLDADDRLQLFIAICNAVQHAHQKGIIHRDLKPSNVLVTLQDGKPIPKVIDFGIVKAIGGQQLTDKTLYTRLAAMMGTPAYMSPEQAEMSNVDVDTRSDIYSLGVMLYELLTGSTPFTREQLESVGFDELRRIIREDEPQKPSTRLGTISSELATTISQRRRAEPARLTSLMKGDLDWIVMKCLDKDRSRRYATVGDLAEDVGRFLVREPVEARPPSAAYRFSKFARRNKVMLGTISAIASALVIGTAVSLYQTSVAMDALAKARVAEEDATRSRDEVELFSENLKQANRLISAGHTAEETDDFAAAFESYTAATEVQPRYFLVWMERGKLLARLGLWQEAADDFRKALELDAPIDDFEFFGVPQLFYLTGDDLLHRRIIDGLLPTADKRSWSTILRGQLVVPTTNLEMTKISERILVGDTDDALETEPLHVWMPLGIKFYLAGWAHLRAGNTEMAIRRLQQVSERDPNLRAMGIELPLLAMAFHEAGQTEEAVVTLDRAATKLDDWINESLEVNHGAPALPWFDWVEFISNFNEATKMIGGTTKLPTARLQQMRSEALKLTR